MRADISVVIPARNERAQLPSTLASLAEHKSPETGVEVIVVDDGSSDARVGDLQSACRAALAPDVPLQVLRFDEQVGIPIARNRGARAATGDLLFMTDSHVTFSPAWDRHALAASRSRRIICGAVADAASSFRGVGCTVDFPSMGVRWITTGVAEGTPVPVAPSAATLVPAQLFHELGGYDERMWIYGGAEPELSVRAWLRGAEIVAVPGVQVTHRFRPHAERARMKAAIGSLLLHNYLRFGLLYLGDAAALRMIHYHATTSPHLMPQALQLVDRSDVWRRRRQLEQRHVRPFRWFVERFCSERRQRSA